MIHDESIDEERGSMLPRDSSQIELRHLTDSPGHGRYDSEDTLQVPPEPPQQEPPTRFNNMVGRARTIQRKQKARWDRFNGKGRRRIGVMESLKNIVTSSYLNVLFAAVPCAWAAHFTHMSNRVTFVLCFVSMIPMEKFFDYGGEQLSLYCGVQLGDLIIVSLSNFVEAALAVILLWRCELKLLQSTVVGVVVLHLLLIPGTAFLTGGSAIWEQQLHPHTTQLNQSLLTVGVMALVLPSAYFASLDRGFLTTEPEAANLINDKVRGEFLQMSRATAIFLLIIYICSRIFLHNPPGENDLTSHPAAPQALKHEEDQLQVEEPEVNSWICVLALLVIVGLVSVTAEFLVESIEPIREENHIGDEWFGVILLPIISFSADGAVAIVYFARQILRAAFNFAPPKPPQELARARAIDMSIQFMLFWFPMFVLAAWWTKRPLIMLFDMYEVALLLTATFMVNYITQDAKTNWVEGAIMVIFYLLIGLWTWFYVGQDEVKVLLACMESVAEAITQLAAGGEVEAGGHGGGHAAERRMFI